MLRILRRFMAFFQRRENPNRHLGLPQGDTKLKTVQGVVTSLCDDYGLIDESIYFSTNIVTENVPLKIGQKVTAVVEEDKTFVELKATKVDVIPDNFDVTKPLDSRIRVLVGYVTCIKKDTVYIDKKIYFSIDIVSEGFVPYKGDWLEVEYSTQPGTSNIKAHSVKPMNCKHVDEVCITSLQERHGMIDYTIFFTLDSLKLPDGYVPQPYDVVNVVIVESVQLCCVWRAVSMTPVQRSS
ncbi:cancer/testis antigen 55-like [Marmota flaviventris]|uniref:cancer/testis antigen 55 n=1 Tax=Marmota flaviventris TaxID=93162 RepID=UPI00148ED926|nr:cancer/testis antigen 55 [Marmota flaviventris]